MEDIIRTQENETENLIEWRKIHPDFTKELIDKWKEEKFSKEDIKKAVNAGFFPKDSEYAAWLRDEDVIDISSEEVEMLREQYKEHLEGKRWKDQGFNDEEVEEWKEQGFTCEEAAEWTGERKKNKVGLKKNEAVFAKALKKERKIATYKFYADLDKLREKHEKEEIIEFDYINAQKWLDENYPEEGRSKMVKLDIGSLNLQNKEELEKNQFLGGSLDLNDFINLEDLCCAGNGLDSLNLSKCSNLIYVNCTDNQLSQLSLPSCPKKLTALDCNDNLLENLNLSNCYELLELKAWNNELTEIDFSNCSKITKICCEENKFVNLNKFLSSIPNPLTLIYLDIADNNISSNDLSLFSKFINLEKLKIGTTSEEQYKKGYNNFFGSLEPLKDLVKLQLLSIQNTDIDKGYNEYLSFCDVQIDNNLRSEAKCMNLQKEIISSKIDFSGRDEKGKENNSQEWLDNNFPQERRSKIRELNIKKNNLKGSLNLKGFSNLRNLYCSENLIDELILTDCLKLVWLECSNNELRELNLLNLKQLETIQCPNNLSLESLKLDEFNKIDWINADYCHLSNLDEIILKLNPKKLDGFFLRNNGVSKKNLDFFSKLTNLKRLYIGNYKEDKVSNELGGSLKTLENFNKLKELYISNTDVDSDLENLPASLEWIYCNGKLAEEMEAYKEENDGSSRYNYQAWKKDYEEFIEKHLCLKQLNLLKSQLVDKRVQINRLQKLLKNKEYLIPLLEHSLINKEEFDNIYNLINSISNNEDLIKEKQKKIVTLEEKINQTNVFSFLSGERANLETQLSKNREEITQLTTENQELISKFNEKRIQKFQEELKQLEEEKGKLLKRNFDLEILIEESKQIIKLEKEKLMQTYLFFTEGEKKSLEELIKVHKVYNETKKQKKEGTNKLFKQISALRQQIEDKRGEKFMEIVEELVLTNFEDLYENEWRLQQQIKQKELIAEKTEIVEEKINKKITYIENYHNYQAIRGGTINNGEINIIGENNQLNIGVVHKRMEITKNYQNTIKEKTEESLTQSEQIDLKEKSSSKKIKSNWTNINNNFSNSELITKWINNNFTYQETQEWANAFAQSFHPNELDFFVWLRNIMGFTPFEALNSANMEELKQAYQEYQEQFQSHIEILPK